MPTTQVKQRITGAWKYFQGSTIYGWDAALKITALYKAVDDNSISICFPKSTVSDYELNGCMKIKAIPVGAAASSAVTKNYVVDLSFVDDDGNTYAVPYSCNMCIGDPDDPSAPYSAYTDGYIFVGNTSDDYYAFSLPCTNDKVTHYVMHVTSNSAEVNGLTFDFYFAGYSVVFRIGTPEITLFSYVDPYNATTLTVKLPILPEVPVFKSSASLYDGSTLLKDFSSEYYGYFNHFMIANDLAYDNRDTSIYISSYNTNSTYNLTPIKFCYGGEENSTWNNTDYFTFSSSCTYKVSYATAPYNLTAKNYKLVWDSTSQKYGVSFRLAAKTTNSESIVNNFEIGLKKSTDASYVYGGYGNVQWTYNPLTSEVFYNATLMPSSSMVPGASYDINPQIYDSTDSQLLLSSTATFTLPSDKYIRVSRNGGSFTRYRILLSVAGGNLMLIHKGNTKVLTDSPQQGVIYDLKEIVFNIPNVVNGYPISSYTTQGASYEPTILSFESIDFSLYYTYYHRDAGTSNEEECLTEHKTVNGHTTTTKIWIYKASNNTVSFGGGLPPVKRFINLDGVECTYNGVSSFTNNLESLISLTFR